MLAYGGSLIFKMCDPTAVLATVPVAQTKLKGEDVLVCKHSWANIAKLRKLGLQAPSLFRDAEWRYTGRFIPFKHQRVTTTFLLEHDKAFVLSDMGCVDADTEYLSPIGWKRISDYVEGQVGQYNLDGTVEFVEPTSFVKKPCAWMYRFKTSRGIDQKLSPEHRVLYVDSVGNLKVNSAESIAKTQDKNIMGWKGKFITTFTPKIETSLDISEAVLRLQIAVIADGHFGTKTNWCMVRLKKERKIARLKSLLSNAAIEYQESVPEYKGAEGFHIFKFHAPRHDKEFTEWYWAASLAQLQIISDEVVHWDGSVRNAGASGFYSTVKASIDFIQYAYASTGRTASIGFDDRGEKGQCWRVHARSNACNLQLVGADSAGEKTNPITQEPTTDGYKYCFEVPSSYLILRRNGCIFASGNTGKTGSCLWALEYLFQQAVIKRVLITCPLSVLGVWQDELFNIMPHRTSAVLYGSREKRLELLKEGTQVCLINHDGITTIEKELEAVGFNLIIGDEAATYRNAGTKRYKLFRQLAKSVQRLWLLTGTPAPNAPTDVWALIKLVNPLAFAASFGAFKELTMRKISQFIWVPRAESKDIIYKLMKPGIRFKKEDCLDLPPLTYVNRECVMSGEQIKAFESMRKHMAMEKGESGQKITAANAAVLLIKLMQICCGVVRDNEEQAHFLDDSARLTLLKEVIEEAGNKAIVFIPFKAVMYRVKEFLDAAKIGCELVNGDVSQGAREAIFNRFQRGSLPVLLAHPKTAAHGLTLTASSYIIWYGPIFSAENWAQANARIHRPGQKNPCTVVRIGCSKVEWKLYEALNSKVRMQDVILRAYEELTG